MKIDKEDFEISKIEVRKKYGHDIDNENIIARADNLEESNERYVHELHMLEMKYYNLEAKYNELLKEKEIL